MAGVRYLMHRSHLLIVSFGERAGSGVALAQRIHIGGGSMARIHPSPRRASCRRPVESVSVRVYVTSCKECSAREAAISLWDEESNRPVTPEVIERRRDWLTILVNPGYYRAWTRISSSDQELRRRPLFGRSSKSRSTIRSSHAVLPDRVGQAHGIRKATFDRMRGLAGTIPGSARAVSLWSANGEGKQVRGTVSNGAYYFDEFGCAYCVLSFALADGSKSTLGF